MDSSVFLEQLRKRLLAGGVNPSDAEKYVEQFGRYFDNISEEDLDEQMSSLGNIDTIVSNLIELIESKKARSAAEHASAEEAEHGNEDGSAGSTDAAADTAGINVGAAFAPETVDADNTETADAGNIDAVSFDASTVGMTENMGITEHVSMAENVVMTENASAAAAADSAVIADAGVTADASAALISDAIANTAVKSGAAAPVGAPSAAQELGEPDPFCSDAGQTAAASHAATAPATAQMPQHRTPARVLRGNTRVGLRSEPEEFLIDDAATSTREFDTVPDGFAPDAYEEAYRAAAAGGSDGTVSGTVCRNITLDYDDYDDGYRPGIREYIYRGAPLEWAKLETGAAKKAFYGVAFDSLPLSLPAALLAAVLTAAVFLLDGALLLGLALSVAGLAAVGTAFTLVSIIYGITQLGSAGPIGLYEIGIGIMSAGIALGACILIYNLLVRIMPYTFKYLVRFFTYLLYRLKCVIYRFREECAKRR